MTFKAGDIVRAALFDIHDNMKHIVSCKEELEAETIVGHFDTIFLARHCEDDDCSFVFVKCPTDYGGCLPSSFYVKRFEKLGVYNKDDAVRSVDEQTLILVSNVVVSKSIGCSCIRCKDFFPMAEMNLVKSDGEGSDFGCFSCRSTYGWWLQDQGWIVK